MDSLLPIFPLPNVVLFPNVFLPLHIFEPRYREMVADAVANDRLIGMVLLRPGWEPDYEKQPPVYPIGCSGVMTHVEQLVDGRYNIVLRGIDRFRILEEDYRRSYRRAAVEPLAEGEPVAEDRAVIRLQRSKLEGLLAPAIERDLRPSTRLGRPEPVEGRHAQGGPSQPRGGRHPQPADLKIPSAMPDEDLVNALAQYLDFEPLEKQALLEQQNLRARAESLVELLEMKILIARTPGVSTVAH
jgi:Lon protease-like protein